MRNIIGIIVVIVGIFALSAQSQQRNQPWAVEADLLAADTTRAVIALHTATTRRVVTTVTCNVLTAAAQAVDVESSDGAVEVLRLPASATGQWRLELQNGIELPVNTGLRIQPAAAGPAIHCVAEGYNR